jgi:predicted transcriptional regulator
MIIARRYAMKGQRNFHVPLPDELYRALRSEAERTRQPATVLAREAIREWVEKQERATLHQAISEYAQEAAGGEADLDPDLEAASLEGWNDLQ